MQLQYTQKAKTALNLAIKMARKLKQNYIGTEHILLGLIKENTGVAARVLIDNGVDETQMLEMIKDLIAPGNMVAVVDKDGYSPRAMKVLEDSQKQATRFRSERIGTEHILLAILKEGENVAVRLLNTMKGAIQELYGDVLVAMGE